MKIDLKNVNINIKEKYNWLEILDFEDKMDNLDNLSSRKYIYTLVEFIALNFITSLQIKGKIIQVFSDKPTILQILTDLENISFEEMEKIITDFYDFINKKKSK